MIEQIGAGKTILIILSLHGLFLAALMAIGQLVVNRKSIKNLLYLDLFIIFGLMEIQLILFEAGMMPRYPVLRHTGIPVLYALGPVIYFFARFSLDKNYRLRPVHFLHYIPPLAAFSAAVLASSRNGRYDTTSFLGGFIFNRQAMYIWSFGLASLFLYLAAIIPVFKKSFVMDRGAVRGSAHAKVIIVVYCFIVSVGLMLVAATLMQSPVFIEIAILSITVIIIFMFLVNFRYPDYYQTLYRAVDEEKRKRSYLTAVDTDDLVRRLLAAMDDEAYADEDISLPSLSKLLNVSTHQLSELINERYGMNFMAFINSKRIERALALLRQDNESPVLSIAYEVGFKSKSVFNDAFKKVTGLTPSQYRKKA